LPVVFLVNF